MGWYNSLFIIWISEADMDMRNGDCCAVIIITGKKINMEVKQGKLRSRVTPDRLDRDSFNKPSLKFNTNTYLWNIGPQKRHGQT